LLRSVLLRTARRLVYGVRGGSVSQCVEAGEHRLWMGGATLSGGRLFRHMAAVVKACKIGGLALEM
jgi:hypothetical protein